MACRFLTFVKNYNFTPATLTECKLIRKINNSIDFSSLFFIIFDN